MMLAVLDILQDVRIVIKMKEFHAGVLMENCVILKNSALEIPMNVQLMKLR